jgi:hypothetical protein
VARKVAREAQEAAAATALSANVRRVLAQGVERRAERARNRVSVAAAYVASVAKKT